MEWFLGVCDELPSRTAFRVIPRALVSEGCWTIPSEWGEVFPDDGKAFGLPDQLNGFSDGDMIQFTRVKNQRYDPQGKAHDRWMVETSERPLRILDFRGSSIDFARKTLVELGISDLGKDESRVLVALDGDRCVQIEMRPPDGLSERWMALETGLDNLPCYEFDSRALDGVSVEGAKYSVPHSTIGRQVGEVDWRSDWEVLEQGLKKLRAFSTKISHTPITLADVKRLIAVIRQANLEPKWQEEISSLFERWATASVAVTENFAMLEEMVGVLEDLEPVQAMREEEQQKFRDDLKTSLKPVIREELKREQEDLVVRNEALREEIDGLSAELEQLNVAQAVASERAQKLRDEVAEALGGLSRGMEGVPEEAELSRLVRNLSRRLSGIDGSLDPQPSSTPPWSRPCLGGESSQIHWDQLEDALTKSAAIGGFPPETLILADVLSRAGEVVCLPTKVAVPFLSAYARVLAGGSLAVQSLDASIMGVDDLWRSPNNFRPSTLAWAWKRAVAIPERFHVVLLEGVHRTPVDFWLPHLVDVLRSEVRPPNLLVFCSMGDNLVFPDRVWRGMVEEISAIKVDRRATNETRAAIAMGRQSIPASFVDPMSATPPPLSEILEAIQSRFQSDVGEPFWGEAAYVRRYLAARALGDQAHAKEILPESANSMKEILKRGASMIGSLLGVPAGIGDLE